MLSEHADIAAHQLSPTCGSRGVAVAPYALTVSADDNAIGAPRRERNRSTDSLKLEARFSSKVIDAGRYEEATRHSSGIIRHANQTRRADLDPRSEGAAART
ncbi:hypothetical protein [Caballeronia sp. M1242]|uniref:hypothetical protein n=1 Tax=Caballeronia sp. M1242 TaxID=2814653 RepID=UPI0019CFD437|nr:hypothetical protein [Caballeronia sp. M1242]QSN64137.1 hypothetical protein JYK05_22795 [Caballeronia sp. M1242]